MRLAIITLVLGIATIAGVFLQQNPGVIALNLGPWHVQLPTSLAVLALCIVVFGFWLGRKILLSCLRLVFTLPYWWQKRKENKARQTTEKALLHMLESKWQLAESKSLAGINNSPMPLANYLTAAQAAWEQGAWERCEQYICEAELSLGKRHITLELMRAQILYKQGDYKACLDFLQPLLRRESKNFMLLRLLADTYKELQDWRSLSKLLAKMQKLPDCDSSKLQELAELAYGNLLLDVTDISRRALMRLYSRIPSSFATNPKIICAYINKLQTSGHANLAAKILTRAIDKKASPQLITCYGEVDLPQVEQRIKQAESWLRSMPEDPVLLLALARLCVKAKLWGKAKDYLELSLKFKPDPVAFAELGQLYDKLGDLEQGRSCYQQGLLTVAKDTI